MKSVYEKIAIVQIFIHITTDKEIDINFPRTITEHMLLNKMYLIASNFIAKHNIKIIVL